MLSYGEQIVISRSVTNPQNTRTKKSGQQIKIGRAVFKKAMAFYGEKFVTSRKVIFPTFGEQKER